MQAITRITKHYNAQLFLSSSLLTLSSANYARFDNQGMSATQAMNSFIRQFGEYNPSTKAYAIPPYFLSLMNSLIYVGFALGVYLGSVISARYGRRMTVFTMSLWALVSATIVITSRTKEQMLIARILNYIYIGMELSVISVFQAEIMPAAVRGFAVGSYQMSIGMGGIIISSVCYATSSITSNNAWIIPYGLYYVVPTIVASLVWIIPESPRWLLSKGRTEEARVALRRLRVNNSDVAIDEELSSIVTMLENENTKKGGYPDLFKGTNRRRTLIVYGCNFFLQSTGQSFVSAYGTVFFRSIDAPNPFALNIGTSVLQMTAAFTNMYLQDLVGRRFLFMFGACLMAMSQFIIGALGTQVATLPVREAIAGFTMFYGFCFGIGWAPSNWVQTTETPAQYLRDKTVRTAAWVNILTNFVVAFSIPYLIYPPYAGLYSKVGFIFGPICVCAFLFALLFIPELKGRTLEEVDLLFDSRVSALRSGKWKPANYSTGGPSELNDLTNGEEDEVKMHDLAEVEEAGVTSKH